MEAVAILKNVVGPSWTVFVVMCAFYAALLYYKIDAISKAQSKASAESERMWSAVNKKVDSPACADHRRDIERRLNALEKTG
jgi:hypothetical protein